MVTKQLHHDIAAYRTLPLNAYEKVAIINAVLIPQWTYRALFFGNRSRMALWDDILLHYMKDTPGIEQQMNKHCLTTNPSHGGLGYDNCGGPISPGGSHGGSKNYKTTAPRSSSAQPNTNILTPSELYGARWVNALPNLGCTDPICGPIRLGELGRGPRNERGKNHGPPQIA